MIYFDYVLCIDASKSMFSKLKTLKERIKHFLRLSQMVFDENIPKSKGVKLRVKLIAFRDYATAKEPMKESKFFVYPDEESGFISFLDGIEAKEGGEFSNNALEAIALALKSDWTTGGYRRRFVAVFANSQPIPLGDRADCPGYPEGMPKSFKELADSWDAFSARSDSIMALFVPESESWGQLIKEFWRSFPYYHSISSDLSDFVIEDSDWYTMLDWILGD